MFKQRMLQFKMRLLSVELSSSKFVFFTACIEIISFEFHYRQTLGMQFLHSDLYHYFQFLCKVLPKGTKNLSYQSESGMHTFSECVCFCQKMKYLPYLNKWKHSPAFNYGRYIHYCEKNARLLKSSCTLV